MNFYWCCGDVRCYLGGFMVKVLSWNLFPSDWFIWTLILMLSELYIPLKSALRGNTSRDVGLETECGKQPSLCLLLFLPPFLRCLTAQCDSWLMCLSCSSRAQKSLSVVHSSSSLLSLLSSSSPLLSSPLLSSPLLMSFYISFFVTSLNFFDILSSFLIS